MASSSNDENPTQAQIAQKTWELANNIETISSTDEIYRYDRKQQQDILAAKPWEKELVAPMGSASSHTNPVMIHVFRYITFILT